MTKREIQEIGKGTETTVVDCSHSISGDGDGTSTGATPVQSGTIKQNCFIASSSSRSPAETTPGVSAAEAEGAAAPGGNARTNYRSAMEPEGLEVLQLMAKGQALSSAVVVVEGVLHKMEEQASGLAAGVELPTLPSPRLTEGSASHYYDARRVSVA